MHVLGIGTDIIECLRIAQMIERHGEYFIGRVYTQYEIDYCGSRKASTQHYAGRWAAKEAILKALGTGWSRGISWRDMEIRSDEAGRPLVRLGGGARDVCERLGIADMLVSISHCRRTPSPSPRPWGLGRTGLRTVATGDVLRHLRI
jgi:holo-[acyl-carrier protein] synthase